MAVAIDTALLSSVDFSGLIRVETTRDNDFVEFVFSFQDSSNFYAIYSSKSGTNQGPCTQGLIQTLGSMVIFDENQGVSDLSKYEFLCPIYVKIIKFLVI